MKLKVDDESDQCTHKSHPRLLGWEPTHKSTSKALAACPGTYHREVSITRQPRSRLTIDATHKRRRIPSLRPSPNIAAQAESRQEPIDREHVRAESAAEDEDDGEREDGGEGQRRDARPSPGPAARGPRGNEEGEARDEVYDVDDAEGAFGGREGGSGAGCHGSDCRCWRTLVL